jgi:Xaa-Pro dipeptidase
VITADGARVISQFPADQLYVAGSQYWTGFWLDC